MCVFVRPSRSLSFSHHSFIAVEPIDTYCVLISSKVVYFLKPGDFVDREAIFLEVKYDDLYHCLVFKDHGKVYVQLTKKAESTSSGVAIPGPSHQKPMVRSSFSLWYLYMKVPFGLAFLELCKVVRSTFHSQNLNESEVNVQQSKNLSPLSRVLFTFINSLSTSRVFSPHIFSGTSEL